ncbi:MAG: SAM-dependent methyltransferase [Chitinophaga sp.]|uniref:class I SAM-dependent methyltransferase n=1 Tax=Chitinophaga sp. TaxID=1869181 RepID=UPI001B1B83E4|nr:SAM-dependent methyltransferase [Chitinophaga sp.]MBO9733230.1 SAM-dependent methyltransferase [Chitinophaga sp.]
MSRLPATKSGTYMAAFRALESTKPEKERLFQDPFATVFLSKFYQLLLACCSISLFRKLVMAAIQLRWPGTFTSGVARTKLIDDMIIDAVRNDGINQVIILNATFDTRAHRLNIGMPLHYVEMDHPELQHRKRTRLATIKGLPQVPIDYVQLDMNTQQISDVIPQLFYRDHYKTLFIWEALTTELEARLGTTIFHHVREYNPGTQIILSYVDKAVIDNPAAFYGANKVKRLLSRAGEDWDFGMDPKVLRDYLEAHNLVVRYEGGAADYRRQYFGDKSASMKGHEYLRVIRAEVK